MTEKLASPWYQSDKWDVSPWNYHPELITDFDLPRDNKVLVVDSTVRSICTSEPGTVVTPDDLVKLVIELDNIGVQETVFNIGHTGTISSLAFEAAKAATQLEYDHLRISSGCGLLPDRWQLELDKAMEAGVHCLEVSYGAFYQDGFSETHQVFDLLAEATAYCQSAGYPTSVAYNIKSYTNFVFLLRFCKLASELEPRFIRIYDTKTCLSPHGMSWLIRNLKSEIGPTLPPIVIHTHNQWGLATATTIAGVLAGARGIDTAVIAVGTKSGHTPFEETILALEALYGLETGINLERLYPLAQLVEDIIGVPIHPNKPVVGRHVFLCEQAPVAMEALRERISDQAGLSPFSASLVGQTKRVVWGKNTVKPAVVALKLQEMGIEATRTNVDTAIETLQARVGQLRSYPGWIEDEEAESLINAALSVVRLPT